jgi:uncharacterized cupredoxin-like copper-binding protein
MFRESAFALAITLAAPFALAHVEREAGKPQAISKQEHAWGRQGDPRKAVRTIEIDMSDAMRFSPSALTVKRGETVRFVVRNSGQVLHEMVLGTEAELARHAELMKKHPGMEHDEPYMVHVRPGKHDEMAWTFTKAGTFRYGCLLPGHWEAGMKGTIVVTR